MKFQIAPHTLERANERRATENEIIEVLETGNSISAKYGRLGKSKIFPFHNYRLQKYFEEKKVEVYYLIEEQNLITITVYVFYGKFWIMTIQYDSKTDLLYLMIAPSRGGEIINKRVSNEMVLDIGENDKIVGIEIIDASSI